VDEICNATRIRQLAVAEQDPSIDFCYVVGDKLSNNTNNLVLISKQKAMVDAALIESVHDIDIDQLKKYHKVSVTSGASTPTYITNQVINFLTQFDHDDPTTWTKD
jgi:4-hydroxy-3-methylbut-2-enyl diphosphate reductase